MSVGSFSMSIETELDKEVERPSRATGLARRHLAGMLSRLRDTTLVWSVSTGFAIFLFTAIQGVMLARLLGPTMRGEFATAIFYTQILTYPGLLGTQLS